MRPSCGTRFSELGQHLDARYQLVLDRGRRLGVLDQVAVDPEADAVELFVRLEMQVGGAHIDRIHQHLVQETHDRRVFHLGVGGGALRLRCRFFFGELDIPFVAGHLEDGLGRALGQVLEQLEQHIVLHDDGLHCRFGLEFDLVQGLGIGRIGQGHRHLVAALGQRDHPLGCHQPRVDGLGRQDIDIDDAQVEQRVGEGFSTEDSQIARIDGAAR
jgi:hypothetical protein